MPKLLWAILVGLYCSVAAIAAHGQVFSGLWSDPNQPGTSFSVEQEGNTAFVVWYAFSDSSTTPIWLAASLVSPNGGPSSTGTVYQYNAQGFGANFNSKNFVGTPVGSVSVTVLTASTATLQYNVMGQSGTYNLSRVTIAPINTSGTYLGGQIVDSNNCGLATSEAATFVVSQNSTTSRLSLSVQYPNDFCTMNGSYKQVGSNLLITGAGLTCNSGIVGTFSSAQVILGYRTFAIPFSVNFTRPFSCSASGLFGGAR